MVLRKGSMIQGKRLRFATREEAMTRSEEALGHEAFGHKAVSTAFAFRLHQARRSLGPLQFRKITWKVIRGLLRKISKSFQENKSEQSANGVHKVKKTHKYGQIFQQPQ